MIDLVMLVTEVGGEALTEVVALEVIGVLVDTFSGLVDGGVGVDASIVIGVVVDAVVRLVEGAVAVDASVELRIVEDTVF